MRLFNEAIDAVRRDEARKLRAKGDTVTLKHNRWVLLKRKENLSGGQFRRLREPMKANTDTFRAYLLKDLFKDFWGYKSTVWAGKFLDHWIGEAVATGLNHVFDLPRHCMTIERCCSTCFVR
jgi:transposase